MKPGVRSQESGVKSQKLGGRVFILASGFWLLASAAFASQNYLQNVKVYKNSDELRVKIDFSSPVKTEPVPSFYEKSVQFDLPDVYIHPSKRVFDIEDSLLKHIYALQHSKDKVRLRLVLTQNGITLKENLSLTRNKNNLIITIKKHVVMSRSPERSEGETNPSPVGSQQPAVRSEESIVNSQQTEIKNTIEELPLFTANTAHAQDIKPVMGKDEGIGAESKTKNMENDYLKYKDPSPIEPPDISSAVIKTAAALAIVLAAVMIISYIAKKFLKKNDMVFGKDKLIRVLGTSYIGVKKAITLLDVAGEVLVIAVSNNNITMLTKLDSEEAKSRIQGVKGSRDQGIDFSSHSNPRTLESSNPALKDAMVAQITKTIQEKVRNLKRIQ
ncbi:MAG: flagellar biosynthetic protein FliO [Nitrospinae bacterium]|nr:flagellar biosynthetic protein FliO [Nitrospinota bacterium]